MRRELEELRGHYASGMGDFEKVPDGVEVTLAHAGDHGRFKLLLNVSTSLPAHEHQQHREQLLQDFSLLTFVRKKGHSDVYAVSAEIVNGVKWFQVSDLPRWHSREDIIVEFFRPFAREERALRVCRQMQDSGNLCLPLQVLLGAAVNSVVACDPDAKSDLEQVQSELEQLHVSVPCRKHLNHGQREALAWQHARALQLVHGPPGTGKTSVIDGMLTAPCCDKQALQGSEERHVVAVLSEKNLAVDAVAAALCRRGGDTPGHPVWEQTVAHGNKKSFGAYTERFILSTKVNQDRAVATSRDDMHKAERDNERALAQLRDAVRKNFQVLVQVCGTEITVKRNKLDFKDNPVPVTLRELWEDSTTDDAMLVRTAKKILPDAKATDVVQAKEAIAAAADRVEHAKRELVRAEQEYVSSKCATEKRLRQSARVVLCTLGSAHGLLDALSCDSGQQVSVTLICDEASTVHTALFVGAVASIGAHITNIIVIGDDRQLPPYCPLPDRAKPFGSLFYDANAVVAPVFLSQQYRAPRCIMELLNRHFYNDQPLVYAKPEVLPPDVEALQWLHVPGNVDARDGEYVSNAEAFHAVHCALEHARVGCAVLLLTPYRKQLAVLKSTLEAVISGAKAHVTACTVDGAQGQEADVVVLSLVKRVPTRFLTRFRLCVMLSRARRSLVVVGDRNSHKSCRCLPLCDVAQNAAQADM